MAGACGKIHGTLWCSKCIIDLLKGKCGHFFQYKVLKNNFLQNNSLQGICAVCAQLCLTLCDPLDYSPPDSSVPRVLQARILEWVVIPFSWEFS